MTGIDAVCRPEFEHDRLAAAVARQHGAPCGEGSRHIQLDVRPLPGGLQAHSARVLAHFVNPAGRPCIVTFVVKRLEGEQRREAAIYEALLASSPTAPAPRLLGVEPVGPTTCYLYLEWISPWRRWPWADTTAAGLVLEQLAALHASLPAATFVGPLGAWDYELELLQSAQATLDLFERSPAQDHFESLRGALPALRRVVAALPSIRRELLSVEPLGIVIHGDAHPGNAVIRLRRGARQAVLLDWGRARPGSWLEDVSSWLQSLGLWEPEALRCHDTLLRRYLAARGLPAHLGRELRDAYWLAGASNALAGALRYHLAAMNRPDGTPGRVRAEAGRAAQAYLRVIKRADACWRVGLVLMALHVCNITYLGTSLR